MQNLYRSLALGGAVISSAFVFAQPSKWNKPDVHVIRPETAVSRLNDIATWIKNEEVSRSHITYKRGVVIAMVVCEPRLTAQLGLKDESKLPSDPRVYYFEGNLLLQTYYKNGRNGAHYTTKRYLESEVVFRYLNLEGHAGSDGGNELPYPFDPYRRKQPKISIDLFDGSMTIQGFGSPVTTKLTLEDGLFKGVVKYGAHSTRPLTILAQIIPAAFGKNLPIDIKDLQEALHF